jgi:hypothetical protein
MVTRLALCQQPRLWFGTAFLLLLPVPATGMTAACGSRDQTPPVDLAGDARLQQAVTIAEAGISMEELLVRYSGKTFSLSCSRSCKSLKLQIRLKQQPLHRLMAALAELVPGTWTAEEKGGGYRLEMDEHAAARRDRWWRLYLSERERCLRALSAAALAQMRAEPDTRAVLPDNEKDRAMITGGQDFFRGLPPSLQERIAGQISEAPFYRSYLSSAGDDDEGSVAVRMSDLSPQTQELVRQRIAGDLPWNDAFVCFTNAGFHVQANVFFPDGRPTDVLFDRSIFMPPDTAALPLNHTALPMMMRLLGKAVPQSWKDLLAFQTTTVWKNDPPPTRVSSGWPPPRRPDVLNWLADRADIEFVADYYSQPGVVMKSSEKTRPLSRPLEEELNYRAAENDMSWKRQANGIYLFRNNRWYRDDYLEVPGPLGERLLKARPKGEQAGWKLAAASFKNEEIESALRDQMEWEAEVVRTLTRWQIGNGLKWFAHEAKPAQATDPQKSTASELPFPLETYPFTVDSTRIMSRYNTVRFYAGLTPDGRAALLEQRLPFTSLNSEQQAQAVYLLPVLAALSGDSRTILLGIRPRYDPRKLPAAAGIPIRLVIVPQSAGPVR